MENEERTILVKAQFDPKLKTYLFLYVLGMLLITLAGIILVPFWIFGFGLLVCRRYFSHIECVLTDRTLEYKKGYFFRIEKTVLLDKIQDLTLKEGPLLRALGISALVIETAGQSTPEGTGDTKLIGIVDVREFRKRVLAQRDSLVEKLETKNRDDSSEGNEDQFHILKDIRDALKRIEKIILDREN